MVKSNFTFTCSHFVLGVILCLQLFTSWKDPPTARMKILVITFRVNGSNKTLQDQKRTYTQKQRWQNCILYTNWNRHDQDSLYAKQTSWLYESGNKKKLSENFRAQRSHAKLITLPDGKSVPAHQIKCPNHGWSNCRSNHHTMLSADEDPNQNE